MSDTPTDIRDSQAPQPDKASRIRERALPRWVQFGGLIVVPLLVAAIGAWQPWRTETAPGSGDEATTPHAEDSMSTTPTESATSGPEPDPSTETTPPDPTTEPATSEDTSSAVPQVIGMTTFEAKDRLAEEGFTNVTGSWTASTAQAVHCEVLEQEPAAQSRADFGDPIHLTYAVTGTEDCGFGTV